MLVSSRYGEWEANPVDGAGSYNGSILAPAVPTARSSKISPSPESALELEQRRATGPSEKSDSTTVRANCCSSPCADGLYIISDSTLKLKSTRAKVGNLGPELGPESKAEGLASLPCAVEVYREQLASGRHFLHERAAWATSWAVPDIAELRGTQRVSEVVGVFAVVA